jgi:hypothetical protein
MVNAARALGAKADTFMQWGAFPDLRKIEGFFSKLARSVLRHIRVSSKQENLRTASWPQSINSTGRLSFRPSKKTGPEPDGSESKTFPICARRVLTGLAEGQREILVAEGWELAAAHTRNHDPERVFANLAEEGARLAAQRRESRSS